MACTVKTHAIAGLRGVVAADSKIIPPTPAVAPSLNLKQMLSLSPAEIAEVLSQRAADQERERCDSPRPQDVPSAPGMVLEPAHAMTTDAGDELELSDGQQPAELERISSQRLNPIDFASTAVNVDGKEVWVQWASEEGEVLNPIDFISQCVTLNGEDISENWLNHGNGRPVYLDKGSHICPGRRLKLPEHGQDSSWCAFGAAGVRAKQGAHSLRRRLVARQGQAC